MRPGSAQKYRSGIAKVLPCNPSINIEEIPKKRGSDQQLLDPKIKDHGNRRFILYPTHKFRTFWDIVNLILMVYVCTVVPFVGSFLTNEVEKML